MNPDSRFADHCPPRFWGRAYALLQHWCRRPVYWGRHLDAVPANSLVFFPVQSTTAFCGLAGIVAFKKPASAADRDPLAALDGMLDTSIAHDFEAGRQSRGSLAEVYLGGDAHIRAVKAETDRLKEKSCFFDVFSQTEKRRHLKALEERLQQLIGAQRRFLTEQQGHLEAADVACISDRLEI